MENGIDEVTKKQYGHITTKYSGLVFHREENGRYFIKYACSKAIKEQIKDYIKNNS